MRRLVPLVAAAVLAAATLAGCASGGTRTAAATGSPSPGACPDSAAPSTHAFHGPQPDPVPSRPEWVLTDTSGHRFDLGQRTRCAATLVYFGYTHCPDECPTAMADIAAALRSVPASVSSRVQVLFVTTDPKRDTAFVLRRWLDQFSTGFVGLLGTQAQLDAAQTATGIEPAYPDGLAPTIAGHPDEHVHKAGTAPHKHFGPLGYAVAHSAVIFAYDAADRLPVVYPSGVTPADIAADLPALVDPAVKN